MAAKENQSRRLAGIAAEIEKLYREVRAHAAAHPAKRGRGAPRPNPILTTHHRIGELVREYMDAHKASHRRGDNAAKALSRQLGGALKPTHIYNHAKYARFPIAVVRRHVREGRAWRDVAKLDPQKETDASAAKAGSRGRLGA